MSLEDEWGARSRNRVFCSHEVVELPSQLTSDHVPVRTRASRWQV
jgi:hypothetical protein